MKILKIFGLVVGVHLFALVLIFANPGCSSSSKPPPNPADTMGADAPATVSLPPEPAPIAPAPMAAGAPTGATPPITFNPEAPAVAAPGTAGIRFTPTRPGTPAATTLVTEPVADVTPATTYTVASGDNLWNLAKRFNVTTAAIAKANNIKTTTVLKPGQRLLIPSRPAGPSTTAAATPRPAQNKAAEPSAAKPVPSEGIKHVVKPGETLGAIARTYGVRQGDIAVQNNIADPQKIFPGMELTIPGWQPPPGKAGKSSSRPAAKTTPPPTVPTIDPSQPAQPAPPPEVPVIPVEDSPISPAPKNP